MNPAFAALGDPVRRRMLELLSTGPQPVGALVEVLRERAPISQPAASQHLKVLREAGLVTVEADGNRRLYSLDPTGLESVRAWVTKLLEPAVGFRQPLDALATEVARGKRERRVAGEPGSGEIRNAG